MRLEVSTYFFAIAAVTLFFNVSLPVFGAIAAVVVGGLFWFDENRHTLF